MRAIRTTICLFFLLQIPFVRGAFAHPQVFSYSDFKIEAAYKGKGEQYLIKFHKPILEHPYFFGTPNGLFQLETDPIDFTSQGDFEFSIYGNNYFENGLVNFSEINEAFLHCMNKVSQRFEEAEKLWLIKHDRWLVPDLQDAIEDGRIPIHALSHKLTQRVFQSEPYSQVIVDEMLGLFMKSVNKSMLAEVYEPSFIIEEVDGYYEEHLRLFFSMGNELKEISIYNVGRSDEVITLSFLFPKYSISSFTYPLNKQEQLRKSVLTVSEEFPSFIVEQLAKGNTIREIEMKEVTNNKGFSQVRESLLQEKHYQKKSPCDWVKYTSK
ncbi:MAG: hypothetical protein KDD46_08405 [Bdellovibrionales bacterium]|nr:hypothetical protein [Bdellovibrionales bacterium]